jgi:hypothetical protein
MSRDNSKRKQARKIRNKYHKSHLLDGAIGNDHWRGGVTFQLGKDPRTRLDLTWSGIKVPVDLADPNHMDGVAELTTLALNTNDDRDIN